MTDNPFLADYIWTSAPCHLCNDTGVIPGKFNARVCGCGGKKAKAKMSSPTDIDILAGYTDAQLEAELARRKAAREAERQARMVTVVCPRCHGESYGKPGTCGACDGAGTVKAERVE